MYIQGMPFLCNEFTGMGMMMGKGAGVAAGTGAMRAFAHGLLTFPAETVLAFNANRAQETIIMKQFLAPFAFQVVVLPQEILADAALVLELDTILRVTNGDHVHAMVAMPLVTVLAQSQNFGSGVAPGASLTLANDARLHERVPRPVANLALDQQLVVAYR